MKNLSFLILFLLYLPLYATPTASAQDSLSAIAVVNDEIISELDLEMRIRMFLLSTAQPDTPEARQRLQSDVLESLIDERLQAQEAARLGIQNNESDAQDAFARIASSNNMSPDQLAQLLIGAGVRPEYLLDQIEAQLLWQRVVAAVLRPQVDISDTDVNEVAEQIEANAGQPQKRVSEIFLPIDNVNQQAQVRDLARRMYEALQQGANFAGIARQFSKAASAAQGGDRGWVDVGELIPEVEAALAAAAPGQILPPIETLDGIWIISYRESRATRESDVTVTLRQLLAPVASGKPADLEAAARRLISLSGGIASCADAQRVAEANGMASTFEVGTVSLDDLSGTLRNAVASLPIGRPSQPVQVPGGIAVMVVCDRTEVGISLQKIRARLELEALEVLARRYMRDLRREATIETRL